MLRNGIEVHPSITHSGREPLLKSCRFEATFKLLEPGESFVTLFCFCFLRKPQKIVAQEALLHEQPICEKRSFTASHSRPNYLLNTRIFFLFAFCKGTEDSFVPLRRSRSN